MGKQFDLSILLRVKDKATIPIKKVGRAFQGITRPIRNMNMSLSRASARLRKLDSAFKRIERRMARSGFTKIGKRMDAFGKQMALKVSVPLMIIGGLATRSAIKFESAFTGVRKTVDVTEEQFAILKKQLMELALEIPVATTGLFGIAEAAGQLDIKLPNIPGFTKTIAALGIAAPVLEMEQAAIQLAQFANVTQMNQKDFDKLASVLVFLGNNTATLENKILDMSERLSSAGTQIGMTQAEIFGLGAALAQLGLESQMGGTAFSRVMRQMKKEIALNSDKVAGFAAVSGQSTEDFKKAWEENALDSVIKFVEGLGELEGRGISVEVVLDKLGMDAMRIADSLIRASGSGDKFRNTIKEGNKEWERNSALTEELNKRLEDSAMQLMLVKNRAEQTAVSFGNILKDALVKVTKSFNPLMDSIRNLEPGMKKAILIIGGLVIAIGPVMIALAAISFAIAAISAPVVVAFGAITGLVVSLGLALNEVVKNWDDLKKSFGSVGGFAKAFFGFGDLPNLPEVSKPKSMNLPNLSLNKSQADINIKVTADKGSTATVEKIKKTGDSKVSVATEAYLGAF